MKRLPILTILILFATIRNSQAQNDTSKIYFKPTKDSTMFFLDRDEPARKKKILLLFSQVEELNKTGSEYFYYVATLCDGKEFSSDFLSVYSCCPYNKVDYQIKKESKFRIILDGFSTGQIYYREDIRRRASLDIK